MHGQALIILIAIFLPGGQLIVFVLLPGHARPPFIGAGLVQVRVLDWVASGYGQVVIQAPQALHTPSTKIRFLTLCYLCYFSFVNNE